VGHVLGIGLVPDPGKSKIANLQNAVRIDQQISRLYVSVENVGRVQVSQTAQNLVDEHFHMVGRKWL
jgi:hypothetical protein